MPDRSAAHRKLVAEIRKDLGRDKDLMLELNAKGQMVNGELRMMPSFGGAGALDLVGTLTVEVCRPVKLAIAGGYVLADEHRICTFARWIELEIKTGNAKPTKEQLMRIDLVRRRGGFATVLHSVEEARAAIERARRGESG